MSRRKQKRPPKDRALIRGINGNLSSGMENLSRQGAELWKKCIRYRHASQDVALNYLIEHVMLSARNLARLHYIYPRETAQDMAAISRGMFESAINALYLLDDPGLLRLASFWKLSIKEERAYDRHLSKWCSHSDKDISHAATSERKVRIPTPENLEKEFLENLGVRPETTPKWPKIRERAAEIGVIWEYFYDVRYRAYSTWQHGDLSRAAMAPSLSIDLPNMKDRAQSEGIGVLSWAHEILFHFILGLNQSVGDDVRKQKIMDIHAYTIEKTTPLIGCWMQTHPRDVGVMLSNDGNEPTEL